MPNSASQPTKVKSKNNEFSSTADAVRIYLHKIGRIPLLTHEQEIFFAKQVQQMMVMLTAKEELSEKLQREPTRQEWADKMQLEEDMLLQQLSQGQIAKQKMIQANLRLVVSIAKKYQKRNIEFLDLIQEGALGLERGVEKFDPTLGYKFSTYAYWWIRQGITRAIAQQSRTIRLPIHMADKLNKIKRVQRELSQKLGHTADVTEIAQALNLEPRQIRECLQFARQPVSLDMGIGSEQGTQLQDMLKDDGMSPERYTERELLYQDVHKLLAKLTPQQKEVLILRFGLAGGCELTLVQISQRIGICRERVRQLEKQALTLLRRYGFNSRSYLAD
ncbi:RpoD/SigA family RNA polymerase sigma factor [Anabaena cylindrica FACHB-243]|uniref:RNA polymerase, sigma 70 subunit, RpoD subfamily n=1 Tax=Anabaena cylindrica (strain ATCC 27899 / PCC 7122) TaxID=272123 RepID=K9ZRD6_ANACC|nr:MULTISPECIES: sigma-70 family RNA polymerase sigma factor SigB [Anabaena]AFZ61112.1 RNA polymerase, sigma 70 subunit, RpoD subfamily [Anabaena cylindrica PCC 7122]MBD2421586.1 RpoD/SigA family RNA polymerase sigma factor [Anabaena cylindrica FACHB-243]MBY5280515.1 RpoD/SigA family RNA polymerase sigma factor [Anabaena sp. CCAP 1446/1C]MBY5308104.1 RpoD/SigA family RNA polymerase sigma factor [Anabaena sp. CCAP 1446/1C]MCM2405513.1 sigma-70 family RNA polymerase sigma factor SigB [Anabaena s